MTSNDTNSFDVDVNEDIAKSSGRFTDINVQDNETEKELIEDNGSNISDTRDINDDKPVDESASINDEVIYFKGANDVTNPLRKNNVYYKNEHKKSLRDSIKGIKKDMQ